MSAALAVTGLRKRYAETTALDGVDFTVGEHEVVGLVGENGAGKSTLLKCLVGLVQPDEGTIAVRGRPVRMGGVRQAAAAGIGMVFQEQSLVPNVSVAENVLLGCEGAAVRGGVYHWKRLYQLAKVQLDKIGCDVRPDARTDSLSFAERQLVEIAKVLAIEERTKAEPVVLLDEPTSVLDAGEIDLLMAQIQRLRTRASVVFVSHRLDEVLTVADRVYVLRNGQTVAERDPSALDEAELHRLMIGRDATGSHYHEQDQQPCDDAPVRLAVRGLSQAGGYREVSFEVRRGEVLGVAGVQGSGREQLCRTLFGAAAHDAGELVLDGQRVRLRSPREAIAAGIGYVPAERRDEGVVGSMSVAENVSLPRIGDVCTGPLLDRRKERLLVGTWAQRLEIRTPSLTTPIANLSGGNQQKAVLARWVICGQPRLLVLDHPTRGLDVGAKSEVYRMIRMLSAAGTSIVLLADSLPETIALSHRVLVMKDGRVTDDVPAPRDAKPLPVEILEKMV